MLGAGFMGAGIAYVTAQAGIDVVLIDRDLEAADKGKAHSHKLIDRPDQEGPRQAGRQATALLARITPTRRLCRARRAATSSSRRCSRIARSRPRRPRRPRPCSADGDLRLQHLDACRSPSLAENSQAPDEFHRHPLLLAGRADDAGRDHPGQENRRRGARHGDRLSCAPSGRRRSSSTTTRGFYANRCVLALHVAKATRC